MITAERKELELDFEKEWWRRYHPAPLYWQVCPNGVRYDWGLAGPDGAWYTLIIPPDFKDAGAIREAKAFLRRTQDVVKLDVRRLKGKDPYETLSAV